MHRDNPRHAAIFSTRTNALGGHLSFQVARGSEACIVLAIPNPLLLLQNQACLIYQSALCLSVLEFPQKSSRGYLSSFGDIDHEAREKNTTKGGCRRLVVKPHPEVRFLWDATNGTCSGKQWFLGARRLDHDRIFARYLVKTLGSPGSQFGHKTHAGRRRANGQETGDAFQQRNKKKTHGFHDPQHSKSAAGRVVFYTQKANSPLYSLKNASTGSCVAKTSPTAIAIKTDRGALLERHTGDQERGHIVVLCHWRIQSCQYQPMPFDRVVGRILQRSPNPGSDDVGEKNYSFISRQISGGLQDRGTTLSLPALGNCSSQDPEMKERDDQAVPPSRKSQRYVSSTMTLARMVPSMVWCTTFYTTSRHALAGMYLAWPTLGSTAGLSKSGCHLMA
ncbi:hypothetical protein V8E55_004257 [Tylopilus felleus]